MSTERFIIDEHGPDKEAELAGLRWLVQYASAHGHTRAGILVGAVGEVDQLERALGAPAASRLRRDRALVVQSVTLEILLASKRVGHFSGPVFVPWADDARVDKAEEMHPPAICAMPWAEDDLRVWRRSWSLLDLRTGATATSAQQLSPVTIAALEDLTDAVNLGTGLGHQADKALAIDFFKTLRHGGETLDADEIRAWAAAHHWEPRHAKALGELAAKIGAGVGVRGGRRQTKTDMNRTLARWREESRAV